MREEKDSQMTPRFSPQVNQKDKAVFNSDEKDQRLSSYEGEGDIKEFSLGLVKAEMLRSHPSAYM